MTTLPEISDFLLSKTPQSWIDAALQNQEIMLIDHANCEKKAASNALQLMHKCGDKPDIMLKMSKLAREELRHFEQVLSIMKKRGIEYRAVSASRYAKTLFSHANTHEPAKLIDTLIIGAFIEARSCERFEAIAPHLDETLQKFYLSLLKSEARHFQDYLKLAQKYSAQDITERVAFFAEKECQLVQDADTQFRFHSGAYQAAA